MAQEDFRRGGSDRVVRALGGREVAGADRARAWGWTGRRCASTWPRRWPRALVPGGPPAVRRSGRERIAGWFPEVVRCPVAAGDVAGDRGAPGLHRGAAEGRGDGVDDPSRLTAEQGLTASVSSVRRWIAANLAEEAARRRVSVLRRRRSSRAARRRSTTGSSGRGRDPATGSRHTMWAFVMVLACSRQMFVRPVIRMDQESWM